MLPERVRRALLRDLLDAAERLLVGLKERDGDKVDQALADVKSARVALDDGYVCDMSKAFDAVHSSVGAVSLTSPSDAERKAVRDAIDEARGYVLDPYATGERWVAVYYGGGVRSVWGGAPLRHKLEVDAKVLCDRFGVELVAALMRVMAGTNRVATLLHLTRLSARNAPEDSVAAERNFHFAALLTFAYLKELTRAIDALGAERISLRLTDQDPWRELQALRKRWERGKRAKVRDALMFHLGEKEETEAELRRSLASIPQGEPSFLPLVESDPDHRDAFMRFTAAEAILIKAAGLDLPDLSEITGDAVGVFGPLFASVQRILDDLLRQCGARLPSLETVGPISLL
jgi:hypothetical protein